MYSNDRFPLDYSSCFQFKLFDNLIIKYADYYAALSFVKCLSVFFYPEGRVGGGGVGKYFLCDMNEKCICKRKKYSVLKSQTRVWRVFSSE